MLLSQQEWIYLDSYGQITLVEIQRNLKTGIEFARGKEVIQKNAYCAGCKCTAGMKYHWIEMEKSISEETVSKTQRVC